uniref:Uncharacterized protein n=1 Tax=Trypanosoma congolense (strain IL3000) TaxID=1068625 RepID=G0ULB1_TRYCI|nr:hypothetical protein, unlikely [Trypanosoma congolense IL3000]
MFVEVHLPEPHSHRGGYAKEAQNPQPHPLRVWPAPKCSLREGVRAASDAPALRVVNRRVTPSLQHGRPEGGRACRTTAQQGLCTQNEHREFLMTISANARQSHIVAAAETSTTREKKIKQARGKNKRKIEKR